jgi:DNA-binding CsgD family transcriptional regulator
LKYIYLPVFLFVVLVGTLRAQEQNPETINMDGFWKVHADMDKRKSMGQLDTVYFKHYFKTLDLAPHFKDDAPFILDFYKNTAYSFYYNGILPEETIKLYSLFFESYAYLEPKLSDSLKQAMLNKRSFAHGIKARCHAQLQQLELAEAEHQKNLTLMQDVKSIYLASTLANYGHFLLYRKKDTAAAKTYYDKSYEFTQHFFPEHDYLGAIKDHLADYYFVTENKEKAKEIYLDNYSFYCPRKVSKSDSIIPFDLPKFIATGTRLIETNLSLGVSGNNAQILQHLEHHIQQANVKPELRLNVALAKAQWLTAQGKAIESRQQMLRARKLSDSITQATETHQRILRSAYHTVILNRLRQSHQIEKKQKETKIQNQNLRFSILVILALSAIGFLISLVLRRRQHLVNARNEKLMAEQSLALTALKNQQLEMEVTAKERDLSDFALNLSQNQEWAKQLAQKIDALKATRGRERKKNLDALEADIKKKVAWDADTKTFFHRLDKLSHGFYGQLQQKYPDLSKNDIRLCSLIRLKLTSMQIANLQNITLASVNTNRYRLRKKLDLGKSHDLDRFIQSL